MLRKFKKECESSCEYILPDYLGEAKKVLYTSARALESGEFATDTAVEASGVVCYDIVYLDSENKLAAASFSSDYDFSFPLDSERYSESFALPSVSAFSVRLTSPRRVVAKSNVQNEVFVMEKNGVSVMGNAISEEKELEKITKGISVVAFSKAAGVEREYAECAMTLEGVGSDEIEIITSSAYVRISESVAKDGGVNIKGTLVVHAIVRTPDENVFAIKREIPFDETISIDGAEEGMASISDVAVSSVVIAASESEGGSDLTANAILDFSAAVFYNEKCELVSDAFLKNKECENEYSLYEYSDFKEAFTKCMEANVRISNKEAKIPEIKEILSLRADIKCGEFALAESSNIKTEASFTGAATCIDENGENLVVPLKFTAPFDINVNSSCQTSPENSVFIKITPADCICEVDGEFINIRLLYNLSLVVSKLCSEKVLNSSVITKELEKPHGAVINVYYPDPDETLFDVAKKFHTSPLEIAAANSITVETSSISAQSLGRKKLIIR